MSDVSALAPVDIPGLATVEGAGDIDALKRASVAAVVWQRRTPRALLRWIDDLDPAALPKARVIIRPDRVRTTVERVCDEAGTPAHAARGAFVEDVAMMAGVFAGLMGAPFLRLRLDPVTTNSCRRFHRDAVSARLVCTYGGMGTQYGVAPEGAEPEQIFTVPTGMPILLRGKLWPESPASGIVHRSPPIEGTGATRLVLVLDPIFDLAEDGA